MAEANRAWLGVSVCIAAFSFGSGLAHLEDHDRTVAAAFERAGVTSALRHFGLERNVQTAPHAAASARASIEEAPASAPDEAVFHVSAQRSSLPAAPEPPDPGGLRLAQGLVMTGATPRRMIMFTFDDGPDPRTTPTLLDHLDRFEIKAVFFITGSRLSGVGPRQREQAEIAREIVRRGHLIGNHTLSHAQLPLLTDDDAAREIDLSADAIERVVGVRPYLLRPPGGSRSPRIDRLIAARGYTQVLWNVGTGDFQVRDAAEVVRTFGRVLDRQASEEGNHGGIVLMHDTHPWSVSAFPDIVLEIRKRNCALLDKGEELYDIVGDPSLFFEARNERDPSAAARPAVLSTERFEARQEELRRLTRARCSVLAAR